MRRFFVGNPIGGSSVSKRTKRSVYRPWLYRAAPQWEQAAATHKRPTEGRILPGSSVRVFALFSLHHVANTFALSGLAVLLMQQGNVPPLHRTLHVAYLITLLQQVL